MPNLQCYTRISETAERRQPATRPSATTLGHGTTFLCACATLIRSSPTTEAGVAQLVEQLIRNQQVSGSSPLAGSIRINNLETMDSGLTSL